MSTRKSALQRVEEHRAKADQIEAKHRRKILRQSPQWKATARAIVALQEGMACISEASDGGVADEYKNHFNAMLDAQNALIAIRMSEVD